MTTARHQHPNAQQQEGIALAHTINGAPTSTAARGTAVASQVGLQEGRIQQVHQSHRRDYQPPKRRHRDNPDKELCGFDGCNAWPSKKYHPYCSGHAVTMGLRPNPHDVIREREAANGDAD